MTYNTAYFCSNCKHELTWDELVHNRGTCPHCGTSSNGTCVDAIKAPYKLVPKKHPITFFKLFSITVTSYVRAFNRSDVEIEHLKLSKTDTVLQENDL